ncbi:unnamed protein product, partial [Ilex paraguariensis]
GRRQDIEGCLSSTRVVGTESEGGRVEAWNGCQRLSRGTRGGASSVMGAVGADAGADNVSLTTKFTSAYVLMATIH